MPADDTRSEWKSTSDPFGAMWMEFMKSMWPGGTTPQPSNETMDKMRSMFFDVMASQADQFMRSDVFLNSMKQMMDNTMAWQRAMNETLQRGLSTMQVPSRADADHIVTLVRGMEERILEKLDDLNARVEKLEKTN